MSSQDAPEPGPDLAERFREFIRDVAFPCVGAKSALSRDKMRILVARDLASAWDDLRIVPELTRLAADYRQSPELFQTIVVIFEQPEAIAEAEFEQYLWERVQSLTDKDALWYGAPADSRVSDDPEDPHFSLSFGGEAFFVVGLHPGASRPARRFERPALVFNLHDQFEQLRAQNRYGKLRSAILDRDLVLAGTLNPMLARYGESSEAAQYSGRVVGPDWQCPYAGRGGGNDGVRGGGNDGVRGGGNDGVRGGGIIGTGGAGAGGNDDESLTDVA